MVVLALCGFVGMSQWPGSLILQATGHQRPVAVMALLSAAANVGLSIALVRPLGTMGVALGVALGTLIPTGLVYWGCASCPTALERSR
ncbi:MAG: hypothetical protein ACYDAG_18145 [Chloroflexota bacterium]